MCKPKQRMSTFCGTIKKLADGQVPAFFGLVPGECKDKVGWLFFHLAYIYPFTYTVSCVSSSRLPLTTDTPSGGQEDDHMVCSEQGPDRSPSPPPCILQRSDLDRSQEP